MSRLDFAEVVVGEQLGVRASKITAGAEAEKTNELLQALAKAVNMKVSSSEPEKDLFYILIEHLDFLAQQ